MSWIETIRATHWLGLVEALAPRRMASGATPIVPPDSVAGRALTVVIAIMCFLACLTAGATAAQLSYGNTIKKQHDIARAFEQGVDLFTFDSEAELAKLAATAPGARVICRTLMENGDALWPLSRKFGCDPDMAKDLLIAAKRQGLKPYGVSFHVGSQQINPRQWIASIGFNGYPPLDEYYI